jgi:hypothetical protein
MRQPSGIGCNVGGTVGLSLHEPGPDIVGGATDTEPIQHQEAAMTTTPDEPLRDEDIETVGSNPGGQGVRDADGTDADADATDADADATDADADATDADADATDADADSTDADGTDGDSTDSTDGDSTDADGTDA